MAGATHIERELKLIMDVAATLPDLDGLGGLAVSPAEAFDARSVYWDTPSDRLASWGATLRFRGGWWTAKLAGAARDGALARREVAIQGRPGTVPAELRGLLTPLIRNEPLQARLTLEAHRDAFDIATPDGVRLAVLTDDRVSASGERVVAPRFREIEIELAGSATPAQVAPILAALRAGGADDGDPRPKRLRVLGPDGARPELSPPDISATSSAHEVIRGALSTAALELGRWLPVAWIGDPEGVHRARVAMRRLRSDLSTWAPLLDRARTDALSTELSWLGGRLGPVRDLDVLIAEVATLDDRPELGRDSVDGLRAALEMHRDAARASMRRAIRSARTRDLLDDLVRESHNPSTVRAAADRADARLVGAVRARWKKTRRAARRASARPSDAALHRLRLRVKRLRYAAEAAAPLHGAPARKTARAAARLQDALGDLNDAAVASRVLADLARERGDLAFAAGQVSGLMIARAAGGRGAWRPAWKRLRRRAESGWLER